MTAAAAAASCQERGVGPSKPASSVARADTDAGHGCGVTWEEASEVKRQAYVRRIPRAKAQQEMLRHRPKTRPHVHDALADIDVLSRTLTDVLTQLRPEMP